jgi:hypothetical protein
VTRRKRGERAREAIGTLKTENGRLWDEASRWGNLSLEGELMVQVFAGICKSDPERAASLIRDPREKREEAPSRNRYDPEL